MTNIKVLQFVRPRGRQVLAVVVSEDDSLQAKVEEIEKAGLRFTMEHLGGGVTNVSLEKIGKCDFLCDLVKSHMWQDAIVRMVREFDPKQLAEWEAQLPKVGM